MLEIVNFMLDKHNITLFKLYCAITKIQTRLEKLQSAQSEAKGAFFWERISSNFIYRYERPNITSLPL